MFGTKKRLEELERKNEEQKNRTSSLVGALLQAIPAKVLKKKIKEGAGIGSADVGTTLEDYLKYKVDP